MSNEIIYFLTLQTHTFYFPTPGMFVKFVFRTLMMFSDGLIAYKENALPQVTSPWNNSRGT